MSYDIELYEPEFLKRAVAGTGDWSDPDPLPEQAVAIVRARLLELGYLLEHEDAERAEFEHPNADWGLQVSIHPGQIAFAIAFWDDAQDAIEATRRDALELAKLTGLGYYDGQTGETVIK